MRSRAPPTARPARRTNGSGGRRSRQDGAADRVRRCAPPVVRRAWHRHRQFGTADPPPASRSRGWPDGGLGSSDTGVREGPGRLFPSSTALLRRPAARRPERSLAPEIVIADVRRALRGRPPRDRPDRDQHRDVRRRLVRARGSRHPPPRRPDPGRSGPASPRRDGGRADRRLSGRSSRNTSTTSCSRVLGRRRAADDAPPPPAAPVRRRRRAPPDGPAVSGRGLRGGRDAGPRTAIPGVAIHGDVIVWLPDRGRGGCWQRSLHVFIRSIDFAGVPLRSGTPPGPGTAATRMAGHVEEPSKKVRAAELLAVAAEARASTGGAGTAWGPRPRSCSEKRLRRRAMGRPCVRPHARVSGGEKDPDGAA